MTRFITATVLVAFFFQAPAAPKFDSAKAWAHLERLVDFGPRPAGSEELERSRKYIKDQLAAVGVITLDQAWEEPTPIGPRRMVNVIGTIPGSSKNRLVIASHYDTKYFKDIKFVGASDGGSSTAFLLELARVLKARRNALTIELLFLDGEEATVEWAGNDHTYGSRHYVEVAKRNGSLATLKALILVDMIGDKDLQIKKDTNSTPWLNDAIWAAARSQRQTSVFRNENTQIEDDHMPFLEAQVAAVDIIDLEYPAWHTADDTLANVSAKSLQIVGDVLLAALPAIENRLK